MSVRAPRATYRLQLGPALDFRAAAALADYLQQLGASHLYASPCLQAAPGSEHGYDVVDHDRVSEALGGASGFAALGAAKQAHGLQILLDIVPNHMAIGTPENALWWDVLENGPSSPYAVFFDVDWDAAADNRVLLPILGERYIEALESGSVRLSREGARFVVVYHEHRLPAAPRSLGPLLLSAAKATGSDALGFFGDTLASLPHPWTTDRAASERRLRDKRVLFAQLQQLLEQQPELARAVDREVGRLGAELHALDAWLEHQSWRLAYWKSAATELGYRRFFDIHSLAGLRVEDEQVFARTHALVLRWLREGAIDGVRVDHVDGLYDPRRYLERLRAAAPDAYIVVEKILQPDEALPAPWPVDGSTGYDFMRLLDQAQVDPAGQAVLDALAARFAGDPQDYGQMERAAKLQVLEQVLGSELERVVELAHRVLRARIALRDCTRHEVRAAITELLAGYGAYRSYLRPGDAPTAADRALVQGALAVAARHQPEAHPRIFVELHDALLLAPGTDEAAVELALRVQQLTGAVMAKAVEDTLFYRHLRLIALNEVGGSPDRFGLSLQDLHRELQARSGSDSMLASGTHDAKRGEDVRARLLVLSEDAELWRDAVGRWAARVALRGGPQLDGAMQYFFYQTLVGAFPLSEERALGYMRKAAREAKLHTSWTAPDADYEAALEAFVLAVMRDIELMQDVERVARQLARPGFIASLGKTLVKLSAPGVPDLYQGAELWDLRLVDPDNRGPVDFGQRRALLQRVPGLAPEDALRELEAGTPKLWLIARVLGLRARAPELFAGAYRPLAVGGPDGDAVLAFARGDALVTVVPRWPLRASRLTERTRVELPPGDWQDALCGERVRAEAGGVPVTALWARFPVALLRRPA